MPRDGGRWTRVSCGGPPSEIKKSDPTPPTSKNSLSSQGVILECPNQDADYSFLERQMLEAFTIL
jgi:hypothetical protein